MKAAVIYGPRDIRVETVEPPPIKPDEVLVKVEACGICGTDMRAYKMGDPKILEKPRILGHEFSGEIVELGTAVQGCALHDRVVGIGLRPCGQCYWCRQDQPDKCVSPTAIGHWLDGAFADYAVVAKPVLGKTLFHIPNSMSWEVAATVEPVSNACFFAERARLRGGETVVILGAGMMGQTIAQACKAMGANRVMVSEPSRRRRQQAAAFGVEVFDPLEEDPVGAVSRATNGHMANVVFECSGIPMVFRQGLHMLRFGGRMMQVAYFEKTLELGPDIMTTIVDRVLTLQGCAGQDWGKALELMGTESVRTRDLITHRFPLDRIAEAFETQLNADQAIKVIVTP